jgi:CheY-like chemotaxis protein
MGVSILVVDDDEVLVRVLSRVLRGFGHTVLPTTNPEEAVRLTQEHHPHLALIDLCMPAADGLEIAGRLRGVQADLVLILMTAYPFRLAEHPEWTDVFAQVLLKPLDLAVLRGAVEAALGAAGPGSGMVKVG